MGIEGMAQFKERTLANRLFVFAQIRYNFKWRIRRSALREEPPDSIPKWRLLHVQVNFHPKFTAGIS